MRSRRSSVLIAVIVISSAEPGCCAGFNRRDRNLDHGRHRTAQPGRLDVAVRPLHHRGDLGPGAGCGRPAEPGPAHRECGVARPGPERELRRLSSRAEHGTLVGPRQSPSVVALAGRRLCPGRAGRHRSRRYDRAPLGNEDQGIYRDPVRSSHFVKASGLRWLCVMLLAPIPWAGCVWALPFLTVLAPSERYATERGHRHKKLTDWARQALLRTVRWLPGRRVIAVGDSSFSAIELLRDVGRHLCMISRLRLDAGLYEPAPPRKPGTLGRPRVKGARLPSLLERLADPATAWHRIRVDGWYGQAERRLHIASGTAFWHHPGMQVPIRWVLVRDPEGEKEPQAFLCTDLDADTADILRWFVRRWRVETTFEEARRHLGLATQRQWSDLAILRTTPALLGLFSLVTLWATQLEAAQGLLPECVRWYPKHAPTFSDALPLVRRELWTSPTFAGSRDHRDTPKLCRR